MIRVQYPSALWPCDLAASVRVHSPLFLLRGDEKIPIHIFFKLEVRFDERQINLFPNIDFIFISLFHVLGKNKLLVGALELKIENLQ